MKTVPLYSFFFLILLHTLLATEDLIIVTSPAGAEVFLDGQNIGSTPLSLNKEAENNPYFHNPGKTYNFIIHKNFYEGEIIALAYQNGKKEKIELTLQYLKRLPQYDGTFQAGYRLDFYTLLTSSKPEDLEYLQGEIYAKYGKKIDIQGKNPFAKYSWYKLNPYYSDDFLDESDRANLELIDSFTKPSIKVQNENKIILENIEYYSDQEELSLIFYDEIRVSLTRGSYFVEPDEPGLEKFFYWKVVNNSLYLWDENTGGEIYEVALDHEHRSIEYFQPIYLEYEEEYH